MVKDHIDNGSREEKKKTAILRKRRWCIVKEKLSTYL